MGQIFQILVNGNEASQKLRVILTEQDYVLRLDFNGRLCRWILCILDANEEPIVVGIPMHVDQGLIRRYRDPRLPKGELMLFDTSEKHQESAKEDLGERCLLFFEENEN